MHLRRSRITSSAVMLCLALAALLLMPLAASAAPAPASASVAAADATCQKPPPRKDDTIHVIGCLTDNREKPPAPVADVEVSV